MLLLLLTILRKKDDLILENVITIALSLRTLLIIMLVNPLSSGYIVQVEEDN